MTFAPRLPAHITALGAQLALLPATVAVTLGGSRAVGTERPDSDWDLHVYYRGTRRPLDPADVRALGHDGVVSELGALGPIVNNGAFLTIEGTITLPPIVMTTPSPWSTSTNTIAADPSAAATATPASCSSQRSLRRWR